MKARILATPSLLAADLLPGMTSAGQVDSGHVNNGSVSDSGGSRADRNDNRCQHS